MRRLTTGNLRSVALLAAAVAVLGIGCARARVKSVEREAVTLPRPARVVVFDFDTGRSDIQIDTSLGRRVVRRVGRAAETVRLASPQPELLCEAMSDILANRLVQDIGALGFRAERARGAAPPTANDLVIEGQFLRIAEGSTTQRFVIGLGMGGTELRTAVQIFHVGGTPGWQPVKQFDTVTNSSRMPGAGFFIAGGAAAGGAVATSAMVSSGVGSVREFFTSLEADARRTSEQITKQVQELSAAQRW